MADPIDKIFIQLGIDTDKLHADAMKVESTVENLKGKIIGIGTTIAAALGITSFVNDAIEGFGELDTALRETQALSNGTSDVFGEMKQQLMDLASSSKFSTTELARNLKDVVDAGFEGQDAMNVLSAAVKLATSTGEDLGSTVKALLDNLNMMGASSNEAADYANKLFVAMQVGRDSISDTSNGIRNLLPLADQLGISYDEVAAALGTLSNKGLDSSSAAASLRNALVAVLTPTEDMKKLANELGVELSTSALQSKGFAGYLGELAQATQGNTEAINTFFGGARNMTAVLALASDGAKDFTSAIDNMKNGTGQLDAAFQVTSGSLEVQVQAMKNSIQNLALAFGEAIAPMIEGMTKFIQGFASWVKDAPTWQKALAAFGIALASLVPIIKGVSTGIAIMQGLLTGGLGLAKTLAVVGVAIAGTTAIFGSLEQEMKKSQASIKDTGAALTDLGGQSQQASMEKVISGFEQTTESSKKTVQNVLSQADALGKLTQLVTDYNYAQKTGLGDTKEIGKQIQDILTQYPELNSAVVKTASGYELQVSNVKSLVQALTKTLEIEKSRLQTQLAEINNQKQMAALYDTTKAKIDAIDKQLNAAYIKVGDIEKKGEKAGVSIQLDLTPAKITGEAANSVYIPPTPSTANTQAEIKKAIEIDIEALTQQRAELVKLLATYGPYKLNAKAIETQATAAQDQIKAIDTAISNLNKSIAAIGTTTVPTYEREIKNLQTQATTLEAKAKAAKTDIEKQAIGKILDDIYSQLINYYETAATTLAKAGKSTEAVAQGKLAQQYRQMREDLDKSVKPVTTEDVTKEFQTTVKAIGEAIKAGNTEIAKRLYDTAQTEYMDLVIRQYKGELEKSAIDAMNNTKKTLDGYTKSFTGDVFETLQKQVDMLTKKTIDEIKKNEDVYEQALESVLGQIQNEMVNVYISGDTAAFNRLQDMQKKLQTQWSTYNQQQAANFTKVINDLLTQIKSIDVSKELSPADLEKVKKIKSDFEQLDVGKAKELGLTKQIEDLQSALQKLSNVANVQDLLSQIQTGLESGSVSAQELKKQFDDLDKMMNDMTGVDTLMKKMDELGSQINTTVTVEELEKSVQEYSSKVEFYSKKMLEEQDKGLKDYYSKQMVSYLTNLENTYTKLMELTGKDYGKQIADIIAQIEQLQAKETDDTTKKIEQSIAESTKKVEMYRKEMESATSGVMKDYFAGLLKGSINTLIDNLQAAMETTGKDYRAEIEALNIELDKLSEKPKEQVDSISEVEKSWQEVADTLVKVENLQALATEAAAREAKDLINAAVSNLSSIKGMLTSIGGIEPSQDVIDKLLQVNMLIDKLNGKLDELKKVEFTASLTDFYQQFAALVESGNMEKAITLLQSTATAAEKLGVSLDFAQLEPAVFAEYGKTLSLFTTDAEGARVATTDLQKVVSQLAKMSGIESFVNLNDVLVTMLKNIKSTSDMVDKLGNRINTTMDLASSSKFSTTELARNLKDAEKTAGWGEAMDDTALQSEKAFETLLTYYNTYLMKIREYLATGTDAAMENVRTLVATAKPQLQKLMDTSKDMPEVQRMMWQSMMSEFDAAEAKYEKYIEDRNGQVKKSLEDQATIYNKVKDEISSMIAKFGDVGSLVSTVLNDVNWQVVQLEDGTYKLVSPFEDVTDIVGTLNALLEGTNIRADVIGWAIQEIARSIENVVSAYQEALAPAPEKQTGQTLKYAETLANWKNYDENVKRLKELQMQLANTQAVATASFGALGAGLGFLLAGPLGALIGGGLGALLGEKAGEMNTADLQKQIEELQAQLKVTFQEVANALGTSIDSIATSLERAFDSSTYEDFVNNFSGSLEQMTKTALIRAFMSSDAMQPLLENLSNAITLAVMDGVLSPEELEVLKQLEAQLTDEAKPFFDALMQLFGEATANAAGSAQERQTVTGIVRSSISEQTGGMLVGLMQNLNLVTQDIRDILKNGTVNVYVVNSSDYVKQAIESGR